MRHSADERHGYPFDKNALYTQPWGNQIAPEEAALDLIQNSSFTPLQNLQVRKVMVYIGLAAPHRFHANVSPLDKTPTLRGPTVRNLHSSPQAPFFTR